MATWCTVVEFLSFFWSLHAPFVAGLSEWLQRITCQCLLTNDNKSVLLPLLPSLHVTWIPYAQVDELAFLHPDHLREKESLVQNVNLILINEDVHQLFPLTLRFCRWVHPFVQTKQASWMCACFFVMHWSWMFHLWTPFGQLCSHSFFFNLIQTETKAQMLNLKAPTTIWTLAHDIKLVLSVSHVALLPRNWRHPCVWIEMELEQLETCFTLFGFGEPGAWTQLNFGHDISPQLRCRGDGHEGRSANVCASLTILLSIHAWACNDLACEVDDKPPQQIDLIQHWLINSDLHPKVQNCNAPICLQLATHRVSSCGTHGVVTHSQKTRFSACRTSCY